MIKREYRPVLHWAPNHYLSSELWTSPTYNAAMRQGRLSLTVEKGSPKVSPIPKDADVTILIKSRLVFSLKGKWRNARKVG